MMKRGGDGEVVEERNVPECVALCVCVFVCMIEQELRAGRGAKIICLNPEAFCFVFVSNKELPTLIKRFEKKKKSPHWLYLDLVRKRWRGISINLLMGPKKLNCQIKYRVPG